MFASHSPLSYASSIRGSSLRSLARVVVDTSQNVATSFHVQRNAAARLTSDSFIFFRDIMYPVKIATRRSGEVLSKINNSLPTLGLVANIYGFSNLAHYTYLDKVSQGKILILSLLLEKIKTFMSN